MMAARALKRALWAIYRWLRGSDVNRDEEGADVDRAAW